MYIVNLFYEDSNMNRQITNVLSYEKEDVMTFKFVTETGCEVFKNDRLLGFNMIKVN